MNTQVQNKSREVAERILRDKKEMANRPGPYGNHLTCPECGGNSFFMYRSNIHADDKGAVIADCIDCQTSTYASALKSEYHDDKGLDFEVLGEENISITFECPECGKQLEDETIYKATIYEDTIYQDIHPEPSKHCPDHPDSPCARLITVLEEWK